MTVPHYGLYSCPFNGEVISAVRDLFEIVGPSDAIVRIDSIHWQQYNASPVDEMLKINLRKYSGAYSTGSGGSSVTPQPFATGMPAAGSTATENNTSQAAVGSGTLEQEIPLTLNHRERERTWRLDTEIVILSPGQAFVWSLDTAPSVALNVNAFVNISEYGG